jgi:hypothetical protein
MTDAEHIELTRLAWRAWKEGDLSEPMSPFCLRGVRLLGEHRDIVHGPARLLKATSAEELFYEEIPAGCSAVRIADDGRGDRGQVQPLFMIIQNSNDNTRSN